MSSTPTLTSLATEVKLTAEAQTALWQHLDLDPDTDLEIAAAIPPHVLDRALDELFSTENLAASVAGRVSILFGKLRDHVKPAAPPPAVDTPAVVAPASTTARGKMSMVIDQADDGHFDPLGPEERAKYRQNHFTLTGGGSS